MQLCFQACVPEISTEITTAVMRVWILMSTYLGRPAETGLGALPTSARSPPRPENASVADQFSPIRGHRLPHSWNRTVLQSLPRSFRRGS